MKLSKSAIVICCIFGLLFLIGVPTCSSYNAMVDLDETANESWAEVQNQYQRRLDLIPNLVETVKGYARHESETLENVTNARAGITQPSDTALMNAYNQARSLNLGTPSDANIKALQNLDRQMSIYVNAVHEAYPTLQASENFARLQDELAGTENRVAFARKEYTAAIKEYNVKVKRFPGNIVAGMFGFEPKAQFEAESAAQSAPKVQF